MTSKMLLSAFAAGAITSAGTAELVGVVGGQTNVLLDFALIESATGLEFGGLSAGVITPGNLGADSVAFAITSPVSANLPTTFNYDSDDFFETFSGAVEHRGAISFTGSADVTLGNFTIAYDGGVGAFQVITNLDFAGLGLFDVEISEASPLASTFDVKGDLLISNAFANALLDLGLADSDLTGVDVGDAWIQGFNQPVPAPGAMAMIGVAGIFARRRRR